MWSSKASFCVLLWIVKNKQSGVNSFCKKDLFSVLTKKSLIISLFAEFYEQIITSDSLVLHLLLLSCIKRDNKSKSKSQTYVLESKNTWEQIELIN